jgi:hypothetical protein
MRMRLIHYSFNFLRHSLHTSLSEVCSKNIGLIGLHSLSLGCLPPEYRTKASSCAGSTMHIRIIGIADDFIGFAVGYALHGEMILQKFPDSRPECINQFNLLIFPQSVFHPPSDCKSAYRESKYVHKTIILAGWFTLFAELNALTNG